MSYSNPFLPDFRPVFLAILNAKEICPEKMELEVIDEEPEEYSAFFGADVDGVLEQISQDINFLTIYTNRPAYFKAFAEKMYEENGLLVAIEAKHTFVKESLRHCAAFHTASDAGERSQGHVPRQRKGEKILLDFEWEGRGYEGWMQRGRYYIPIHKKPWEIAENLDIVVPIGYNTVIVKRMRNTKQKPERDRFEMAFYNNIYEEG